MEVRIVGEQVRISVETTWEDYALKAWMAKNATINPDGTHRLADGALQFETLDAYIGSINKTPVDKP